MQLPFHPTNSLYSRASLASLCGVSGVGANGKCNLFQPGTIPGQVTTYDQYDEGQPGYNTDWNNFGPSLGAAWRPNVESGWLRTILGDPEQATLRGGFARGLQPRVEQRVHRAVRQQPRLDDHAEPHGADRSSRPAGRDLARPAARYRAPRAAAVLFGDGDDALHAADAELSDAGEPQQQRQRLRSRLAGRAHELVVGRTAAIDREGHGGRSPLRRDAQPRWQHHPEPQRDRRR